jgi:hypothetical protein
MRKYYAGQVSETAGAGIRKSIISGIIECSDWGKVIPADGGRLSFWEPDVTV